MNLKNTLSRGIYYLSLLLVLGLVFNACSKEETATTKGTNNVFAKYTEDNTQWITAEDMGNGHYEILGAQGTMINIKDALVNAQGEAVRGPITVELIEIYALEDIIMHRRQTMADYDGTLKMLETGGEFYLNIYQNGEEVSIKEGEGVEVLLPVDNTPSSPEGMELYYGEEVGEQIIWKPTNEAVKVVNLESRADNEFYFVILETLGEWINIDKIYELQGEPVECVSVEIKCEGCEINPATSSATLYFPGGYGAFEIPFAGGNNFKLCSEEGPFPIGGITAYLIVMTDCGQGQFFMSLQQVVIDPANTHYVIYCEQLEPMDPEQAMEMLSSLPQ